MLGRPRSWRDLNEVGGTAMSRDALPSRRQRLAELDEAIPRAEIADHAVGDGGDGTGRRRGARLEGLAQADRRDRTGGSSGMEAERRRLRARR